MSGVVLARYRYFMQITEVTPAIHGKPGLGQTSSSKQPVAYEKELCPYGSYAPAILVARH